MVPSVCSTTLFEGLSIPVQVPALPSDMQPLVNRSVSSTIHRIMSRPCLSELTIYLRVPGAIRFLIFAKPHLTHASIHHKTLQGTRIPARPDLLINPVMNNQFHLLLRYARPAPDPDLDFEQIEERLNCPEIGISSGKSSGTLDIKHNQTR